jgi:glycosyltransferase involved in cell wall biosynthesis
MDKRKQISLIYQFDSNWIGGTYYIINIIKSLLHLSDIDKPKLLIIYNLKSSIADIENINYPYIAYHKYNFEFYLIEKSINFLAKLLIGRILIKKKINLLVINNLYPAGVWTNLSNVKNYYYWIPDFQEKYLPQYFSRKEINDRTDFHKYLVKKDSPIIFSSQNAINDFNKFYPLNTNKTEVLPFISIIDNEYKKIKKEDITSKFNIKGEYFICSNQFWQHKNHFVVLKALKELKNSGIHIKVVFTGKQTDYRNPNYFNEVLKFVKDSKTEDYVQFLGFIDRNDQLALMKYSKAIIQPSLFEGWSTVVEDAKALNKYILLSDIPLHREQIQINCSFFDPLNFINLSKLLSQEFNLIIEANNLKNIELEFANSFIKLFDF